MSLTYDPRVAPLAEEWLAESEEGRIEAVTDYCLDHEPDLPNLRVHAVFHVIIENQIAMDAEPVPATLRRLMDEGLSRHQAIHAIGSRLAEHVYDVMNDNMQDADPNSPYFASLRTLTAKSWRASGDPNPARRPSAKNARKKRRKR